VLDDFATCQTALPLLLGQLIHLMQLADHPLLIHWREPAEIGVIAQQPFLLRNGKRAMLIEPVAQVARRKFGRRRIPLVSGPGKA